MKSKIVISVLGVFLILGCCSTKPIDDRDVPDWYLNPPKYKDKFVGVGDALIKKEASISNSKNTAELLAKGEVSGSIETMIVRVLNDYYNTSGLGKDASTAKFTENVIISLSSTIQRGCETDSSDIMDNRIFVMVTYDLKEARMKSMEAIRNAAKEQKALQSKLTALKAFEALDKDMESLKTGSSVAAP